MDKKEIISKIESAADLPKIPKGSSAVIIPLVEVDGEIHVLFEERSHKLVFQPGEICFPGGRVEAGESPLEAAVREFVEELLPGEGAEAVYASDKGAAGSYSINKAAASLEGNEAGVADELCRIDIIAELTPLMGPTGALVYPYAALIENYHGTFSADEVERVFTFSLDYLLEHPPVSYAMEKKTFAPPDFPYEKVTGGKSEYKFHVQHYDMWVYEEADPVIWGFTGRLLHSFLEYLQNK